jgi:hypothetical protein
MVVERESRVVVDIGACVFDGFVDIFAYFCASFLGLLKHRLEICKFFRHSVELGLCYFSIHGRQDVKVSEHIEEIRFGGSELERARFSRTKRRRAPSSSSKSCNFSFFASFPPGDPGSPCLPMGGSSSSDGGESPGPSSEGSELPLPPLLHLM